MAKILHINGKPINKIPLDMLCHYMKRFEDLSDCKDINTAREYTVAKEELGQYLKKLDKNNVMCRVLK